MTEAYNLYRMKVTALQPFDHELAKETAQKHQQCGLFDSTARELNKMIGSCRVRQLKTDFKRRVVPSHQQQHTVQLEVLAPITP